ncbi:MAG: alpha-mannosidase, partial [Spirochaetales bacterium]|nr:alpha-mannosidase [Spirochaetales bacterium]
MITDKRLYSTLKAIQDVYTELIFYPVCNVPMKYIETKEHYRNLPADIGEQEWKPAEKGTRWGGDWGSAWFKGKVVLPESCEGKKVFACALTGGKETLFLADGVYRGLFNTKFNEDGGANGSHLVVMMTGSGVAGKTYKLAFEAYAGHPCVGTAPHEGKEKSAYDPETYRRTFDSIQILLRRDDVKDFVFDLKVLLDLAEALDEHSLRKNKIISELTEVFAIVDQCPKHEPEEIWREKLKESRKIMAALLSERNSSTVPLFGLTGHSHMDTAWLWTLDETTRKCARTFSSVLNLMEQYGEFIFLQSSPYQAELMREEYPEIFDRIKKMVKAGRWEPNGGMWIEADCNIPSGESFIRQFLLGQHAIREMFNTTSDVFWLPDTFGYSAALPQIMKGCGIESFCTTKLSWNDTTRFPYDTFIWKGIDGSAVLSHFTRIDGWPDPKALTDQWQSIQHKDVQDRRYCPYGYGDGGGGPQYEMIEVARRVKNLEGCPVAEHQTISAFMKKLKEESPNLPIWTGELYLELHRGALTSMGNIKRGNRKLEFALRDAEFLWSLAHLQKKVYPSEEIQKNWKILLLNQFHDILPGTSIPEVHDRAIDELDTGIEDTDRLSREALAAILSGSTGSRKSMLIVNSLSWERSGNISLTGVPTNMAPADPEIVYQIIEAPDGKEKLIINGLSIPALGAEKIVLENKEKDEGGELPKDFHFRYDGMNLETPRAYIKFDEAGRIISFIDKESGREIVRKGEALNTFWCGEDVPVSYDNWDIDRDQCLKMEEETRLIEKKVIAAGPLQLRIRSVYKIGLHSTLKQDMVFHAGTPKIDFETVVDWKEKHRLLKVSFNVNLLSDRARHEIQYGHVERNTHGNLLTDRAQFEVCNHKWTDISESRFGVALLNDCKYGISVNDSDIRLTLLKSGTHPDPRGDEGIHYFTYALLPHKGSFSVESVVRPAYELNVEPIVHIVNGNIGPFGSLLSISESNVIVESIKKAD